ncbi:hypothetical protein EI94DRAFT_1730277 [Lactarius quietus]|nr:hypothetical protein EI94DRAFT_1730277 [Lactarius quietus]
MAYYDTYRDQLASLHHGHALWAPNPAGLYDQVTVGDVGYVRQGHFLRMFNALLPANDPAQVYGVPDGYVPLNMGPFQNMRTMNLDQGDYCSSTVSIGHHGAEREAAAPLPVDATITLFKSKRDKALETYTRKHCDCWLDFAIINSLDVQLEDIILVTGCDLTSSWAMAVFVNPLEPEITLTVQPSGSGSAEFQWSHTSQPHHHETTQNTVRSHSVFIRGFTAKRIFYFFKRLKAAAEPGPDDLDNVPESSIELARKPGVPEYRNPLMGILDFIAEDVLTADAVESFLHRNKIPVRAEHGAALLANEDEVGPADERLPFSAQAHAGVRVALTHPANMRLTVLMEDLFSAGKDQRHSENQRREIAV